MEERIRPRRPIHAGRDSDNSPSHRSLNRREIRHLSPHLSGSEDDENDKAEMYDTTASPNTTNSSLDVPDGVNYTYSQTVRNKILLPNGVVKVSEKETKMRVVNDKNKEPNSNFGVYTVAILLMVIVAVAVFYIPSLRREVLAVSREPIQCSFDETGKMFPNQDEMLWKSLKSGVEGVLNNIPTKPSIFLFAYEDAKTVHKITQSIVQRTIQCMDSKANAVELNPGDLSYNEMKVDYGVVIAKYKNQLSKSGIMLINDLNKVPSDVARAFHALCDVHNPLVDRSIIFLTMQFAQSNVNANPLTIVEHYLRSNWSELNSSILDPLITRVTDEVFVLKNE
ncbi:hypothetical protein Bhyg_16615 [Pseudolycoriella hygida]|uniref:Uncharacterized protein n=1 Tax=Pseudolycoriella hygida TaxID=35572 RepID=A0A9Q0MMT7_9DIPT|nr:hypothetical protein Bhyg_16615 [Pseudolycoriella hygida]